METEELYIEIARKQHEDDQRFVQRLETAMHKAARVRTIISDITTIADQQRNRELSATPWGRDSAIKSVAEDYAKVLDAIEEMKIAVEAIDFKIRLNID